MRVDKVVVTDYCAVSRWVGASEGILAPDFEVRTTVCTWVLEGSKQARSFRTPPHSTQRMPEQA